MPKLRYWRKLQPKIVVGFSFSSSQIAATISMDSKRLKMLKICTHSGSFHADESLAVYMLKLLPKFKDYELIRSRNPEDWKQSEIVVDVGGQYDGVKWFDHHQREFFETFNDSYKTKLSSAGLVYKHFGKDIISHKLKLNDSKMIDGLHDKIYKEFIEAIDANDNGINKYEEQLPGKFNDRNLTLPMVVSNLNPLWYENPTDADFDACFQKSSALMGQVFENILNYYGKSFLLAKEVVTKAFESRFETDKSGQILKLATFCPWKEHVYDLENEHNASGQIKFILFQDSSTNWRVSTVSVKSGSFEFRQGLLEPWRGVRDEELSKLVGIDDGIFVHAAGFIGGAKSYESVLKMAQKSL